MNDLLFEKILICNKEQFITNLRNDDNSHEKMIFDLGLNGLYNKFKSIINLIPKETLSQNYSENSNTIRKLLIGYKGLCTGQLIQKIMEKTDLDVNSTRNYIEYTVGRYQLNKYAPFIYSYYQEMDPAKAPHLKDIGLIRPWEKSMALFDRQPFFGIRNYEKSIKYYLEHLINPMIKAKELNIKLRHELEDCLIMSCLGGFSIVKDNLVKYIHQLKDMNSERNSALAARAILNQTICINSMITPSKRSKPSKELHDEINSLSELYKFYPSTNDELNNPKLIIALSDLVGEARRSNSVELKLTLLDYFDKIHYEAFANVANQSKEDFIAWITMNIIQHGTIKQFQHILSAHPKMTYILQMVPGHEHEKHIGSKFTTPESKSARTTLPTEETSPKHRISPIKVHKKQPYFVPVRHSILMYFVAHNKIDFLKEYDKNHEFGKQIIPPGFFNLYVKSEKIKAFIRDVQRFDIVLLACLFGRDEILKLYINKAEIDNSYIVGAINSGNFETLDLLLKKLLHNNPQLIAEFIISNNLLFKVIFDSHHILANKIIQNYLLNKDLIIKLDSEDLKKANIYGETIFHFISMHRMTDVFYSLLELIFQKLCEGSELIFISLMTDLFQIKTKQPQTIAEIKLHSSPLFSPGDTDQPSISKFDLEDELTPLMIAIYNNFYEMINLADQYGITYDDYNIEKVGNIHHFSRFMFTKNINPTPNRFNKLFVANSKLYHFMKSTLKHSNNLLSVQNQNHALTPNSQILECLCFGREFLKRSPKLVEEIWPHLTLGLEFIFGELCLQFTTKDLISKSLMTLEVSFTVLILEKLGLLKNPDISDAILEDIMSHPFESLSEYYKLTHKFPISYQNIYFNTNIMDAFKSIKEMHHAVAPEYSLTWDLSYIEVIELLYRSLEKKEYFFTRILARSFPEILLLRESYSKPDLVNPPYMMNWVKIAMHDPLTAVYVLRLLPQSFHVELRTQYKHFCGIFNINSHENNFFFKFSFLMWASVCLTEDTA